MTSRKMQKMVGLRPQIQNPSNRVTKKNASTWITLEMMEKSKWSKAKTIRKTLMTMDLISTTLMMTTTCLHSLQQKKSLRVKICLGQLEK